MTELREPQFCPSCAAPLREGPRVRRLWHDTDDVTGWDCHCSACGWSGDIIPDEEAQG